MLPAGPRGSRSTAACRRGRSRQAHEAGANLLVAGSAIYDAPSPGEAYQALVAAVTREPAR